MSTNLVSWIALVIAGLLEVGWAVALKSSAGFSRLWPTLAFLVLMTASMGLLAYAVRTLPLGTAYALWTGIGVLGSVICGILLWGEPLSLLRAISVILLLAGMAGLKLTA